jgi:hypothetical protein
MARSRPTPPLAQHGLRQLRAPGSDSGTRRGGHGHRGATTPTLAVLAVWLPAASPRSTSSSGSDTADAGTHGYQMLTPDTRRRTPGRRTPGHPDTGHPDAQTPTPDTGHRSRGHRTRGRRTPAEDGRGQVDQGTAGIRISWGHHAGRLPRWDADPCSCGWRLRRSAAHASSAVRPPASPRPPIALPAARPLRRLRRASAHCCRVLDGTRGGQWDYGKVRGCGVGLVRRC